MLVSPLEIETSADLVYVWPVRVEAVGLSAEEARMGAAVGTPVCDPFVWEGLRAIFFLSQDTTPDTTILANTTRATTQAMARSKCLEATAGGRGVKSFALRSLLIGSLSVLVTVVLVTRHLR